MSIFFSSARASTTAMIPPRCAGRTGAISEASGISTHEPYPDAHFATFPPALVEPCIKLGSSPSEFILDPFVGSGTAGVAVLKLDRRFVVIECNPSYLQIAEHRLNGDLIRLALSRAVHRDRWFSTRGWWPRAKACSWTL